MIVNDLDLGSYSPWKIPVKNFHTALTVIPGGYALPYGDHADPDEWKLRIWVKAPASVGQYAAGTQAACEFLSRQLEEMCRNPDLQPLYLQFYAGTGVVAHSPAFSEPQDGWYYVTQLTVDYTKSQFGFSVVDFTVQSVNPGPPRRIGMYTTGAALSSTYSGAGTNWAAFPFGSTVPVSATTRTGAEGAIGLVVSTQGTMSNPVAFVLSSTIANWFKGGCRVYDAMAVIGTNPVPTGGTFTHANWIEVKGPDHRFVGDVIVTNGLLLMTFSPTASSGIVVYLWNTALATPAWQSCFGVVQQDNALGNDTLQQISLLRVGLEEVGLQCLVSSAASGTTSLLIFRLQRGSYAGRVDYRPLIQSNTNPNSLWLNWPTLTKIVYNSGVGASTAVIDGVLTAQTETAAATDYGYGAAFINSTSYPFIGGWLYQNAPANQPYYNQSAALGFGDTSSPTLNATSSYGFFAIPFGSVSGGTTTDKLQAEAESGTLGTGWSSQANAAASAGNEAKCASGTLTGNADTFGTAFVPPAQVYDVWFRVKVTSAAGAASEMKLGLYNSTDSVFVSSTTYKANQVTTGYAWYKAAAAVTPTATKNMRFRAETTATIGTDWFVDEAALVPTTDGANSVRDIWQQFIFDRTAVMRRG